MFTEGYYIHCQSPSPSYLLDPVKTFRMYGIVCVRIITTYVILGENNYSLSLYIYIYYIIYNYILLYSSLLLDNKHSLYVGRIKWTYRTTIPKWTQWVFHPHQPITRGRSELTVSRPRVEHVHRVATERLGISCSGAGSTMKSCSFSSEMKTHHQIAKKLQLKTWKEP